jgi:phosphoribosylanthranilate isomerase
LRNVRVKICGITRPEDLAEAVDAGADAVGFLVGVPSSPRNITIERTEKLLKQVPIFINSIVVTAVCSIEELVELAERLKPTAIQIHGKKHLEASEVRKKIRDTRLIKTIYVNPDALSEISIEDSKIFDAILLDSFTRGQYGGTGKVHDWTLSRQIREAVAPIPVILAGGLNPENVKEAILTVQPYAVDVASGVELRPGIKDPKKLRAFIANAKEIKISGDGTSE